MASTASKISIDKLLLDLTNFRIGEQSGQPDAIKAMLLEQGDGLVNIAEHICANDLAPNKSLIVAAHPTDKGFYIVKDGNRRTAAIKLVMNPALADGTPQAKKFRDLNVKHSKAVNKNINCIELSEDEAAKWVRVEHYKDQKGVAQEMWSSIARARADRADGKKAAVLDALDFAVAGNLLSPEARKIAESNDFNLTNLDRMLGAAAVKKKLGLTAGKRTLKSKKPKEWVLKVMSEMVSVVATEEWDGKKFKVGDIYDAEKQAEFADKIIKKVGASTGRAAEWTVNQDTAPQITLPKIKRVSPPRPVPASASWNRECVIPQYYPRKSFQFDKLNNVYRDLKMISCKEHPIAAAVLFRMMLELTVKKYCQDHSLSVSEDKLIKYCRASLNYIKNNNLMDKVHIELIDNVLNKEPVNITFELNKYVHHQDFHPDAKNLNIAWDNLEPFFKVLWADFK